MKIGTRHSTWTTFCWGKKNLLNETFESCKFHEDQTKFLVTWPGVGGRCGVLWPLPQHIMLNCNILPDVTCVQSLTSSGGCLGRQKCASFSRQTFWTYRNNSNTLPHINNNIHHVEETYIKFVIYYFWFPNNLKFRKCLLILLSNNWNEIPILHKKWVWF